MSKKVIYIGSNGFETEVDVYESSDHTATGGSGQENKPVLTDAAGQLDVSFIPQSAISHSNLSGLTNDDHLHYLNRDGSRSMTGDLNFGGKRGINVAAPQNANDVVNKAYADALGIGNRMKGNVAVATTGNLATLSGLPIIDTYQVISGDRILVKDQLDAKQNGVYVAAIGAWTRSEDLDNAPMAEILNGVLVPRVLHGAANLNKPFYISSVGTGVDGMHIVGTDNIVFGIFTSPTQLSPGEGISFNGNVVDINTIDSESGLKFVNHELGLDWSISYDDAKPVKASDLNSTAPGKGCSILKIADAGNYTDKEVLEDVVQELYSLIETQGVEYDVGVGGIAKGALVYISANNVVKTYSDLAQGHHAPGVAATSQSSGEKIKVLANDTLLRGVSSGMIAGEPVYWTGSGYSHTMPNGGGAYVYQVGIAANATDLHVEVEFKKRNG